MALTLWAGTTSSSPSNWGSSNILPSAVSMTMSQEPIWNADAGRNAKGDMIATFIAQKFTYQLKWGLITYSELQEIRRLLPNGFFRFGYSSGSSTRPTSAGVFYRSEMTYELIQAGDTFYYKDLSVSVIQK